MRVVSKDQSMSYPLQYWSVKIGDEFDNDEDVEDHGDVVFFSKGGNESQ